MEKVTVIKQGDYETVYGSEGKVILYKGQAVYAATNRRMFIVKKGGKRQ